MIRKGDETSGAEFSDCEKYRFSLWRTWTQAGLSGRLCCFIGLNPSVADETMDDPTIRRCINFCKAWGYDGYVMLNLFAFRATDPKVMKAEADPVGDEATHKIIEWADRCELVVAAWGVHGTHRYRCWNVMDALFVNGIEVHALGHTKDGYPRHPLYLRADTKPVAWI